METNLRKPFTITEKTPTRAFLKVPASSLIVIAVGAFSGNFENVAKVRFQLLVLYQLPPSLGLDHFSRRRPLGSPAHRDDINPHNTGIINVAS